MKGRRTRQLRVVCVRDRLCDNRLSRVKVKSRVSGFNVAGTLATH